MEDKNNYIIIKCPKCGYEYLAAEIFYPNDLLGHPGDILRDDDGKILMVSYNDEGEPCLEEEWECEHCGHTFTAKLKIKADTEYDSRLDFSDDYTITVKDEDKEDLFS